MTYPSLVSGSLLIPAVASCGLAACFPIKEVSFTSKVNRAPAAPIAGMLAVDAQSLGLGVELHRGFEIGLAQRLGTCGVRAMLTGRPAQLEPGSEAVKVVQPVAVMSIELASPPLIQHYAGSDAARVSAVFALKLEDIASHQTTWVARSKLEFHLSYVQADAKFGAWFATQIVSRLRDDGVLTGCPTAAAGWPEVDLPPDPAAAAQPTESSSP